MVIAVLLVPVLLNRDDFPLATYPMYARERAEVVSITTALGIDGDGDEHELGLGVIGETDDPLIAVGELRAAVRAGGADRRCLEIAGRADPARTRRVIVVTERHDVVEHVRDGDGYRDREVHAECEVPANGATD